MRQEAYDIAVIGAGPAGAMAAKTAAELGADVIVLERKTVPGVPERCGGMVSEEQLATLFPIEQHWMRNRLTLIRFHIPNGNSYAINFPKITTLILDRTRFDQWLVSAAESAGATIQTDCLATGLCHDDNSNIAGVNVLRDEDSFPVKARVVIGADGIEMRSGRWANLKTSIPHTDAFSSHRMLIRGIHESQNEAHFVLNNEFAPCGYLWLFPRGDSVFNAGIVMKQSRFPARTAKQNLKTYLTTIYGSYELLHESSGGLYSHPPFVKPVGNGILLAGDCAGHINPFHFGGIFPALMAGKLAGETAVQALHDPANYQKHLDGYTDQITSAFGREHEQYYRMQKLATMMSDHALNRSGDLMRRLPFQLRTPITMALSLFLANPVVTSRMIKEKLKLQ